VTLGDACKLAAFGLVLFLLHKPVAARQSNAMIDHSQRAQFRQLELIVEVSSRWELDAATVKKAIGPFRVNSGGAFDGLELLELPAMGRPWGIDETRRRFQSVFETGSAESFGLDATADETRRAATGDNENGWIPLFNSKDFAGWEKFLGKPPGGDQFLGVDNDPFDVFTVVEIDGGPAICISGEVLGALTTLEEYENYWLRLEFKWGEKRWPPDENTPRNSGVLYHCFGPHGAIVEMCMRSHECQIKEKECGDYWSSDAIVDVEGEPSSDPKQAPHRYRPGGRKFTVHDAQGDLGGRVAHLANHEKPWGQWNRIDLVCLGQTAIHAVNGQVNIVVTNSRRTDDSKEVPLTRGKLQLLSEHAEIYLRRIELRAIREVPEQFAMQRKP
jgi:hypothetical protein